jgi:hypothetical protein
VWINKNYTGDRCSLVKFKQSYVDLDAGFLLRMIDHDFHNSTYISDP